MKTDFKNYKVVVEKWLMKISKDKSRPEYLKDKLQRESKAALALINVFGSLKQSRLYKEIRDHYYLEEFDKIDSLFEDDDDIIKMTFTLKQIREYTKSNIIREIGLNSDPKLKTYNFADRKVKDEIISAVKTLIKLEEINYLAENIVDRNWRESQEKIKIEDWSQTNANEKLLYLDKLGILSLLKKSQPFNTSSNSLANVLTAITGEKMVTLQPILSAMERTNSANKNNPYNSKKLVKKVEATLARIKFEQNQSVSALLGKK